MGTYTSTVNDKQRFYAVPQIGHQSPFIAEAVPSFGINSGQESLNLDWKKSTRQEDVQT
jgi:hypothetical protein